VKETARHSTNSLRFMALGISSPHSQKLVTDAGSVLFLFPPSFGCDFPLLLFRHTVIGPILPAVGESQHSRDSASSHTSALIVVVMTSGRQNWATLKLGENISFDASLVMYINSTSIPPIMIMNRMCGNQNLLYIVPCGAYQECVLEVRGSLWGRPLSNVLV
jgi:hypothetical protein